MSLLHTTGACPEVWGSGCQFCFHILDIQVVIELRVFVSFFFRYFFLPSSFRYFRFCFYPCPPTFDLSGFLSFKFLHFHFSLPFCFSFSSPVTCLLFPPFLFAFFHSLIYFTLSFIFLSFIVIYL